ncbi:MAG: patatin-like phospholipase family protein [Anaerolineaceae bacterium]|nr:patatin-like phospholipase family protein [Anaerolineaceae bacterium]
MAENTSKRANIFQKIDRWLYHKPLKTNYRNLVFKGGGIRGIAYLGAVEELEHLGHMEKIQRVAGSSVGAISALMVSLRLPAKEIKALFDTLDFSRIPQTRTEEQPSSILTRLEVATCSQRLLRNFGWYSSEYFYNWLKGIIAEYTDGNPDATFSDLRQKGYRDLYVVVSNMTKRRAEVMSVGSTPHIAVADAIRMSMSIPLYFEALHFDGETFGKGDLYVDGGLFNNYPVEVFDRPDVIERYISGQPRVNLRTLGLYLYPERDIEKPEIQDPSTLIDFINLLMENLYSTYPLTAQAPGEMDQQRTIRIGDCGVSSTNFNIKPNDETYQALYESGRRAVQAFFFEEFREE